MKFDLGNHGGWGGSRLHSFKNNGGLVSVAFDGDFLRALEVDLKINGVEILNIEFEHVG